VTLHVSKKELLLLLLVAVTFAAIIATLMMFSTTAAVAVGIASVAAATGFLQLETFRRLQLQQNNDYRQTEAMISVVAALQPAIPLPPLRG